VARVWNRFDVRDAVQLDIVVVCRVRRLPLAAATTKSADSAAEFSSSTVRVAPRTAVGHAIEVLEGGVTHESGFVSKARDSLVIVVNGVVSERHAVMPVCPFIFVVFGVPIQQSK